MTEEPIALGNRRELLIDAFLIETMTNTRQVLHHPIPREVCLDRIEAWEGNVCSYTTVFRDGDICRMYYRGDHRDYLPESCTNAVGFRAAGNGLR